MLYEVITRARAAELLGRIVASAEERETAWAALDRALVIEEDPGAFREIVQARDALSS